MSGFLLLRRRLPGRSLLNCPFQARHYGILGKKRTQETKLDALPQTPARTRFAPSPTGYLHLGSIRTALYNYLLARATGGQFIIRLEDTDRTRFVPDAEKKLYEDLKWAGMDWDEGPDKGGKFGPYKQSERLGLYKEHADILLNNGRAFRCFCSNKPPSNVTLDPGLGWNTGYPGTCKQIPKPESDRRAANGEPHTIRFDSSKDSVEYVDIVYGLRNVKHSEEDPIIMKTDGFPTYHFANVVDDHHMEITHVIRGAEWLISTPLHIDMYQALEWKPPSFGHVGLLVDQQRQKLSKRDRDNIGVSVFRENYILPHALMNFSILLGWNPQLEKKRRGLKRSGVMTMKEMQDDFTMKFTRGDIVVDLTKLKFFQSTWTRGLIQGDIPEASILADYLVKPIASVVTRAERILFRYSQYENSRRKKTKPPELSPDEKLFLDDLGIVIEHHHSLRWGYEHISVESHVLNVLRAAKDDVNSPEQFVRDNKYAFFPPRTKGLETSASRLLRDVANSDITYTGSKGKPKAVKIHFVMNVYHNQMRDLRDKKGGWTEKDLLQRLKTIANTVSVYDRPAKQYDLKSGWRYLKWALLCAEPESNHLSITKLLLAWGPERSFKMMRRAKKAALAVQKKHDKNYRKERRLKAKAMKEISLSLARQKARKRASRPLVRRIPAIKPEDKEQQEPDDEVEAVEAAEEAWDAMLREHGGSGFKAPPPSQNAAEAPAEDDAPSGPKWFEPKRETRPSMDPAPSSVDPTPSSVDPAPPSADTPAITPFQEPPTGAAREAREARERAVISRIRKQTAVTGPFMPRGAGRRLMRRPGRSVPPSGDVTSPTFTEPPDLKDATGSPRGEAEGPVRRVGGLTQGANTEQKRGGGSTREEQ